MYFYRDKDGYEIDLVIEKDNILYPIEIKRSAMPKRAWAARLSKLNRFSKQKGNICLSEQLLPIDENVFAYPVSVIG